MEGMMNKGYHVGWRREGTQDGTEELEGRAVLATFCCTWNYKERRVEERYGGWHVRREEGIKGLDERGTKSSLRYVSLNKSNKATK